MWNEGSRLQIKQVHEASINKGVEAFQQVIGELHNVVANAHKDVKIMLIHGSHRNPHNVWKFSNELSDEEEMELMIKIQNAVHKAHYAAHEYDPEKGITAEDMVDDQQTIRV